MSTLTRVGAILEKLHEASSNQYESNELLEASPKMAKLALDDYWKSGQPNTTKLHKDRADHLEFLLDNKKFELGKVASRITDKYEFQAQWLSAYGKLDGLSCSVWLYDYELEEVNENVEPVGRILMKAAKARDSNEISYQFDDFTNSKGDSSPVFKKPQELNKWLKTNHAMLYKLGLDKDLDQDL